MSKKRKSNNYKIALISALVVVILATIGFLTYRLMDSKSTSSENASAGLVKEMTLEGFKLVLTPSAPTQSSKKYVATTTWKYTITGNLTTCSKPNVEVQNEAKPSEVVAQKVDTILLVLDLAQKEVCTAQAPQPYTYSGTFQSYTSSYFRFVVQYSAPAKKITKPAITTPLFESSTQGFTLSSKQRKNGVWAYTITGKSGDCYVPTVETGSAFETNTTNDFAGVYRLRLAKSVNKECTKKVDLKQTGTVNGSAYKGGVYYFKVRYTLNADISYKPTTPVTKTITNGKVKMEYTYNSDSMWSYSVTGCAIQRLSTTVAKGFPPTAIFNVTCSDVLNDKVNVKTGTIIAPEDATFKIEVNPGG